MMDVELRITPEYPSKEELDSIRGIIEKIAYIDTDEILGRITRAMMNEIKTVIGEKPIETMIRLLRAHNELGLRRSYQVHQDHIAMLSRTVELKLIDDRPVLRTKVIVFLDSGDQLKIERIDIVVEDEEIIGFDITVL